MNRQLLWFRLPVALLILAHCGLVLSTVLPEQKKKTNEFAEVSAFDPGGRVQLQAEEFESFARAFGFTPQEVKTQSKQTEYLLSDMSPKLLAVATSGERSVALISVTKDGKAQLLKMAIGDLQYGFELVSVDDAKIELKSAERTFVLYLFKYMKSPEPGGV